MQIDYQIIVIGEMHHDGNAVKESSSINMDSFDI